MRNLTDDLWRHASLRQRAALRVNGPDSPDAAIIHTATALGVLHRLASSADTATEALSLLHELQVHQVELELQDEELRASRVELEMLVNRHLQLYDSSPAGSFTIDQKTCITELNLAAARLLGLQRPAALGRRLDSFLADHDKRSLQSLLLQVSRGEEGAQCEIRLNPVDGARCTARLSASVDPAGPRFILAAFAAPDARGM